MQTESSKINLCFCGQLIFIKGVKSQPKGKQSSIWQIVLNQLDSKQKWNDPTSHHVQKLPLKSLKKPK